MSEPRTQSPSSMTARGGPFGDGHTATNAVADRVRRIGERLAGPEIDPPEPWEQRIRADQVSRFGRGGLGGHPYRPLRRQDIPPSVAVALARASGARRLEQYFVIPAGNRRTGARRTRHVATPTQVLALGDEAIALWVDASSQPGVRAIITLDTLAAIDDRQVLLDGRLSFLSADRRLTVRYNTVGRSGLQPAISAVRAAVAGDPYPLPTGPPQAELPVKWRNVARSPRVRLAPSEPALLLFAPPPAAPRETLVAITAHELVIAREPPSPRRTRDHGVDNLSMPRRRLQSVTATGGTLRVRSAGLSIDIAMGAAAAQSCVRILAARHDNAGELR